MIRARLLARPCRAAGAAGERIISGIQCPGANGGSVHSRNSTRGRRRRGGAASTSRRRERCRAARSRPASARPTAAPRATNESSTSASVCGSTVSTSALHPRCARASSTTETSTAQTAQRSWVTTRSASSPASAPSSSRYRSSPRAVAAATNASISAGVSPSGIAEVDTIVRARASGREVALEGHPDDVVAGPEGEEDLGGRGEQADDAHAPTLR